MRLLFILLLLPFMTNASNFPADSPFNFAGNKYYVATDGSNSNNGTSLATPFLTWEYLSTVMHTGDSAFIRGGTYLPVKASTASAQIYWQNLSNCWIGAYQNEKPIFNLTSLGNPLYTDPYGLYMINCTNVTVYGLRVTGLKQNTGGTGISRGWGFVNCPSCKIIFCTADNIGGSGFNIYDNCNNMYFLNDDAYYNQDPLSTNSPAYGGADGFDATGGINSTGLVFEGCRSWWNSDDAYDNFKTDGTRTYKNCWGFRCGFIPGTFTPVGNGSSFKLGPTLTDKSTVLLRMLNNCLAFDNGSAGFDQNGTPTCLYQLYNNDSYRNHGYGLEFAWSGGMAQNFKNNISYANSLSNFHYGGLNTNNTNNTWNNLVTVTNADFVSLDTTGMSGPRGSDGSLPVTSFLRLATGSDLTNSGVNVGLPFVPPAPDMGAFEYSSSSLPTVYAGPDQNITGTSTTLVGTGTGTSITYGWTQLDGGTITTPSSATTGVTGLVPKAYRFVLTVTDASMNVARDTVLITVSSTTTPVVTPTKYIQASANILSRSIATVTWKVNSVSNSKGFDIYKTYNGSYTKIASIKTNGTSYSQKYSVQKGTTKFKIWSNEIVGLPVTVEVSVKKN